MGKGKVDLPGGMQENKRDHLHESKSKVAEEKDCKRCTNSRNVECSAKMTLKALKVLKTGHVDNK